MKLKLFYYVMIVALVTGFSSCGDDDDPVMGDKSDLIGKYTGNEKISITSVGGKTPEEMTGSFELRSYVQNKTQLMAYVSGIGDGILASDFRITSASYTFSLAEVPNFVMTGNEIPAYIVNWFKNDYPDGYNSVTLKLNAATSTFDRKTNIMSFTYSGSLVLSPKGTTNTRTENIAFEFTNLKK